MSMPVNPPIPARKVDGLIRQSSEVMQYIRIRTNKQKPDMKVKNAMSANFPGKLRTSNDIPPVKSGVRSSLTINARMTPAKKATAT